MVFQCHVPNWIEVPAVCCLNKFVMLALLLLFPTWNFRAYKICLSQENRIIGKHRSGVLVRLLIMLPYFFISLCPLSCAKSEITRIVTMQFLENVLEKPKPHEAEFQQRKRSTPLKRYEDSFRRASFMRKKSHIVYGINDSELYRNWNHFNMENSTTIINFYQNDFSKFC